MTVACLSLTQISSANAALIHNLSVTGAGFSGSGQITFNTDNGNSAAGVDAFNFDVTSVFSIAIPLQSFDENDINLINWNIASDWSLTLFLQTNLVAAGISNVSLVLTNDGALHGNLCQIGSTNSPSYCGMNSSGSILLSRDTVLTPTAIEPPPQVSEPGTLALFGLGLAGLGFARRRKAA